MLALQTDMTGVWAVTYSIQIGTSFIFLSSSTLAMPCSLFLPASCQRSFLTSFILMIKFTVLKGQGNSLHPGESFSSHFRHQLAQGSCSGEERCDLFFGFLPLLPFCFWLLIGGKIRKDKVLYDWDDYNPATDALLWQVSTRVVHLESFWEAHMGMSPLPSSIHVQVWCTLQLPLAVSSQPCLLQSPCSPLQLNARIKYQQKKRSQWKRRTGNEVVGETLKSRKGT